MANWTGPVGVKVDYRYKIGGKGNFSIMSNEYIYAASMDSTAVQGALKRKYPNRTDIEIFGIRK